MNYSLEDLRKADNLLRAMLAYLGSNGLISDVDEAFIDFTASAFKALEREFLEGPEEEDNSSEGLCRRGVRHVCSAVYRDGTPVISRDKFFDAIDDSAYAYWSENCPADVIFTGLRQIVHSDLMVKCLSDIKPNSQYFEYCRGKLCRRIMVERVDTDTGLIYFIDLVDWSKGVLGSANYGIMPYTSIGLWNTANWLESIDMSVSSAR